MISIKGGVSPLLFNNFLLLLFFLAFNITIFIYFPNIGSFILKPYEYISLSIFTLVIFISFIKFILEKKFVYPNFSIYYLVFILLSILPSFFSYIENYPMFLFFSGYLLLGFLYWISLHQYELKQIRNKILIIFYISAIIHSTIAYMQLFNLTNYFSSLHIGTQITSVFQQKNVYASFIATNLIVGFLLLQKIKNRAYLYILSLSLIFISSTLIIAFSRAGLIGFVLGFIAIIIIARYIKQNLVYTKTYVLSIFLGFIIGWFVFDIANKYIAKQEENIFKTYLIRESSNMQRILMFKSAFKMFSESPIYGVGLGDFIALYPKYQEKVLEENPDLKKYAVSASNHPHNEIFRILAEGGIIGFTGFLILIFGFFKLIYDLAKEKNQSLILLPLLIPIAFHSLVEFPLDLSLLHKFMFLTILSFITYERIKILDFSFKIFTLQIAGLLFSGLVLIWSLKTFIDYSRFMEFIALFYQKKTFKPQLVENAKKNWYLSDFANRFYYDFTLMILQNKKKFTKRDIELLFDYVKHAEYQWYKFPTHKLLHNEIVAFILLGKATKNTIFFDKAMELAEKGEKIYPNLENWKKLKAIILNELILSSKSEDKGANKWQKENQ